MYSKITEQNKTTRMTHKKVTNAKQSYSQLAPCRRVHAPLQQTCHPCESKVHHSSHTGRLLLHFMLFPRGGLGYGYKIFSCPA